MELYIKMSDEEYEEYKELKQKQDSLENDSPQEYLKRNGFKEYYISESFNARIGKPTRLTIYKKDNCTITIEVELE
jgi:hypothetical protein